MVDPLQSSRCSCRDGLGPDLVVPTFFATKSSRHQGSKVRATNLHGTWKTGQTRSSMLLLMLVALTEQQIGTELLFLGHHCFRDSTSSLLVLRSYTCLLINFFFS